MKVINFTKINNIDELSNNLGCTRYIIEFLLNENKKKLFYDILCLYKRKNKIRLNANRINIISPPNKDEFREVINIKNDDYRLILKNINFSLSSNLYFTECVQGFIKNRTIVSNAQIHLSKKYIVTCDIENFFESIAIDKVKKAFLCIGINEEISSILSKLCTIDSKLKAGLNTSPTISNIVCIDLDKEFDLLAKKYNCDYSRYADDITFSSEDIFPKKIEIETILNRYDFKINKSKYKVQKRGCPQYVTGLTVFDSLYPRISKKIKKRIRLTNYYINKYGFENHFKHIQKKYNYPDEKFIYEFNKNMGWIFFINSVEPNFVAKYLDHWRDQVRQIKNIEEDFWDSL